MKSLFLGMLLLAPGLCFADLASCNSVADDLAQATRVTYKSPAYMMQSGSAHDADLAEYVYKYDFDYAIPYDDDGRGTMVNAVIEIRLKTNDCSLRKVEVK